MNSKADEIAYHRRPTTIGVLMVAGRGAVIAGEEERVHNVFEADPRLALSLADRDARLAELRPQLAKRRPPANWGEREAKGETVDRTYGDPEMFLRVDRDLISICG